MQYSRRDMLDELMDFVGESGDDDARDTAEKLLSRVIQTIWLKKDWADHRLPDPYSFTTTANTRNYVLPDYFGRVAGFDRLIRNVTLGSRIRPISQDELDDVAPEAGTTLETSGLPARYILGGTQGVLRQPSSVGEAIEVVSSSPDDVGRLVTVEGQDTSGEWLSAQVALNGTVAVLVGTFRTVINFSKAIPDGTSLPGEGLSSAGIVTLRTTAGLTTLEALKPSESAHERLVLSLYPKPDAPYLIAVPVIRAPKRLIADSDELPRYWGPAVMEECRLEWGLNTGDIKPENFPAIARPCFRDLVQFDNSLAYQDMRVQAFGL